MKGKAFFVLILGWLFPGLGHAVQKKTRRAAVFALCIASMTVLGIMMGGRIYNVQWNNPLTLLVLFADLGNGLFFLLSRLIPFGLGNPASSSFEIGTAYVAGAGLLNYLIALDALDIAAGKKP